MYLFSSGFFVVPFALMSLVLARETTVLRFFMYFLMKVGFSSISIVGGFATSFGLNVVLLFFPTLSLHLSFSFYEGHSLIFTIMVSVTTGTLNLDIGETQVVLGIIIPATFSLGGWLALQRY